MKEKKEKTNIISIWLKKIFSLQFIGVLLTGIGLIFTYNSFLKEKPGEMRLFNKDHKFDKNISFIFYGFEIKGDSLYIKKENKIPSLANYSQNPIIDFKVIAEMPNNIGFRVDDNYNYFVQEDEDSIHFPHVYFSATTDRLGAMTPITFPIAALETNSNEIQINYIRMGYMYQGVSEMLNLFYYIVGIPQRYRDDDGNEISAEYAFIKAIRPYMLYILENEDPQKLLIIFDKKCIESPTKLHLLKDKDIKIQTISELQ